MHEKGLKLDGTEDELRDYRLLISARGDLDTIFESQHEQLGSESQYYSILREEDSTEANACKMFRSQSRILGNHERLLGRPHRQLPYILFLAVFNSHLIQSILDIKVCLRDRFTKMFLADWDLNSDEARMVLLLLLILVFTDSLLLETRHAWIRRLLLKAGVQAKRLQFLDVASHSFSHRVVQRWEALRDWVVELEAEGAAASSATEKKPKVKQTPGQGGAWHAWFSEMLKSGGFWEIQ